MCRGIWTQVGKYSRKNQDQQCPNRNTSQAVLEEAPDDEAGHILLFDGGIA